MLLKTHFEMYLKLCSQYTQIHVKEHLARTRGDEKSSALSVFSLTSALAAVGSWQDFKELKDTILLKYSKLKLCLSPVLRLPLLCLVLGRILWSRKEKILKIKTTYVCLQSFV